MGIEARIFSARSTYAAIDGSGDSERDELWRFVWKLALPQNIRVSFVAGYSDRSGGRVTCFMQLLQGSWGLEIVASCRIIAGFYCSTHQRMVPGQPSTTKPIL
ncbi:hypothetical protein GQ457_07G024230 [Hibiscus cannabinus]